MLDMPYFMENKEWYEYDEKQEKYVLTEKATEKAKESYAEYYKELEEGIT